jgi:hypothetical protein
MGDAALFAALRTLDDAWVALAAEFGFAVVRAEGAYVAYDGAGTISVAPYHDLDPDDCLAQIVLHELCHHLVEGTGSRGHEDWGLDNITDHDAPRELAALRLQAGLLDRHGLREVLAPTTDFRPAYDAFPHNPFDGPAEEVEPARQALARWDADPRSARVDAALRHVVAVVEEHRRAAFVDG